MASIKTSQKITLDIHSESEAKMPRAINYIIGNELAEIFSAYGMRAILVAFMTQYLFDNFGNHLFSSSQAIIWYHNYNALFRY